MTVHRALTDPSTLRPVALSLVMAAALGNLIASSNAVLQMALAERNGDYPFALVSIAVTAAISIATLAAIGHEARDIRMH